MPKFYYYKMTVDNGGAPCVANGVLTLAICKPLLRSTCKVGDVIFGFATNEYDNALIYVAEVTDKLDNGRYYKPGSPYETRPDCIYRQKGNSYEPRPNPFHDAGDLEHDLGPGAKGFPHANVLLSTRFRYFGEKAGTKHLARHNEIKQALAKMKQGHHVNHSLELAEQLGTLKEDIFSKYRESVLGKPRDKDTRKKCYTDDGSELVDGGC